MGVLSTEDIMSPLAEADPVREKLGIKETHETACAGRTTLGEGSGRQSRPSVPDAFLRSTKCTTHTSFEISSAEVNPPATRAVAKQRS
jgi:hypothetical protein